MSVLGKCSNEMVALHLGLLKTAQLWLRVSSSITELHVASVARLIWSADAELVSVAARSL